MRLVGFAYTGVEPHLMGIGPVPATERVLAQAGLTIDDIGLFELNEPFAVQVLTWCEGVGVSPDDPRLNPSGGAIACGHPLAATGVRLMAQLAFELERRPDVRYGLTALCIGLGMGAALLWENTPPWLSSPTQFFLQEVETRVGPLALVTMDNGEDWQKPNVFGRAALESLGALAAPTARAALERARPHRQAVRLRRRRRPDGVPADDARRSSRGPPRKAGHDAFAGDPRPAVPDARRDQRRRARRRPRDRSPLRLPHARPLGPPPRLPGGLPRDHPGLGWHPARSPASSARRRPWS